MKNQTISAFRVGAGPIVLPEGLAKSGQRFAVRSTGRAFRARVAGDVAELDLYDEIGFWGVTAADFKRQLRGITAATIRLNINSPGGDVFDGIAMYNDLLAHPAKVEVHVTGLAASAASLIAMAGDRIVMAENAFMMIHNAWGVTIGDRNEHAETAELLAKVDEALVATYAERAGVARQKVAAMMDKDTWLNAEEAVDQGFADALGETQPATALFDLEAFKGVPEGLARLQRDAEKRSPRDADSGASAIAAALRRCASSFALSEE